MNKMHAQPPFNYYHYNTYVKSLHVFVQAFVKGVYTLVNMTITDEVDSL